MTQPPRSVAILVLLACWAFWAVSLVWPGRAHAQGSGPTVYRCGAGTYSSEPCPGGVKLDTPAPPTPEQQRQAREAAAREAKLAQQLADERKARERAAAAQAINVGPSRPSKTPAAGEKTTKPGKDKKDSKGGKKTGSGAKATKADKPAKASAAARSRKASSSR